MLERLAEQTRKRELERGQEQARIREAKGSPCLRPRRVPDSQEAQERVREAHRVLEAFRQRETARRAEVRRIQESQELLWTETCRQLEATSSSGTSVVPTTKRQCVDPSEFPQLKRARSINPVVDSLWTTTTFEI